MRIEGELIWPCLKSNYLRYTNITLCYCSLSDMGECQSK